MRSIASSGIASSDVAPADDEATRTPSISTSVCPRLAPRRKTPDTDAGPAVLHDLDPRLALQELGDALRTGARDLVLPDDGDVRQQVGGRLQRARGRQRKPAPAWRCPRPGAVQGARRSARHRQRDGRAAAASRSAERNGERGVPSTCPALAVPRTPHGVGRTLCEEQQRARRPVSGLASLDRPPSPPRPGKRCGSGSRGGPHWLTVAGAAAGWRGTYPARHRVPVSPAAKDSRRTLRAHILARRSDRLERLRRPPIGATTALPASLL